MTIMMSRSGAYKQLGNAMLALAGTRFISSATTRVMVNDSVVATVAKGTLNPLMGSGVHPIWAKTTSVYWAQRGISVRNKSTLGISDKDIDREKLPETSAGGQSYKKGIVSYWGATNNEITKDDGTEWKWTCFRPWETDNADMSIDLKHNHAPTTFVGKFANWTVKSFRWPTDLFFQRRYGCLETVAAVPAGMGYLKEEAIYSYTQFSELDKGNINNGPASATAIDYSQHPRDATLRPLSPHLLIYKPQSNSTLSIFNRISGAFLSTTVLLFYLLYLKTGLICFTYESFYQFFFYSSKLIPVYLSINAVALAFHLFKSIRLLWSRFV